VVVLVPIALGAPAVFMFVPPSVTFAPATLAGFVQFTTLVVCLSAVTPVFFDGFVQFVFRMSDSALTAIVVFGVKPWDCGAQQSCRQYGS